MEKIKLNVEGMTCSSCVSHVEKAISNINGTSNISVNLLLNIATFNLDTDKSKVQDVIDSINSSGYSAEIYDDSKNQEIEKDDETQKLKKKFLVSIIFLIPLMIIAMSHMFKNIPILGNIYEYFSKEKNALLFMFLQFILLIPIVYINRSYYLIGFKKLIKRSPNMDSLVALGSSAAIVYGIFSMVMSVIAQKNGDTELLHSYAQNLYFESAATIVTIVTLGKYLESKSKGKTKDAISKLVNLRPKKALVLIDSTEKIIDIDEIKIGDVVVIKPGDVIPVDGTIIKGESLIDESNITGESIPCSKQVNSNVISGSINKNGVLLIKVQKVGENTVLSQIINLVKEASSSKAPISKLVDKVSYVFVPFVILISIFTTIIWIICGADINLALNFGISVLVISCPCALGLATPVAIMVGTGKSAENGIMIKSAESLEIMQNAKTVILDKTGTITEGRLVVTDIITNIDELEFLSVSASIEKSSQHPLSSAIISEAENRGAKINDVSEFLSYAGRGIEATLNNVKYFAGNLEFIEENNIMFKEYDKRAKDLLNLAKTVIYVANENEVIGIIAAEDKIRDEARDTIDMLNSMGIHTVMLTGDNSFVAEKVSKNTHITEFKANMLPKDKEEYVSSFMSGKDKVIFVGDGVNDSPSLSRADVGISMGGATDIAIESSDVVLMKNNLLGIVSAIKLSKNVMDNIKLSLFWAFIYNIIAMPVACGALYNLNGIKLSPMIGSICMSLSSICVVTNALRIKKFNFKYGKEVKSMEKEIKINGMMCNHCKMSVEKALNSIEEVSNVIVDLDRKSAVITLNKNVEDEKIINVIKEAGYEVVNIESK